MNLQGEAQGARRALGLKQRAALMGNGGLKIRAQKWT